MTTADNEWSQTTEPSHRVRSTWKWVHARSLKARVAFIARVPDRFTASQLIGGAAASAGLFVLWGLGIGLLATGLSVVFSSVIMEGRH